VQVARSSAPTLDLQSLHFKINNKSEFADRARQNKSRAEAAIDEFNDRRLNARETKSIYRR
jgi:hypothetical protein